MSSIGQLRILLLVGATLASLPGPADAADRSPAPANVLLITVDTLRADRLSAYGYERETSPHLDRLIGDGVRFANARTIEPLTGPAVASMITSLYPHEHGASRNGLRVRPGLASLPKVLQGRGYTTAAFVGNWTLRDKLSGLAEHFEHYEEVLTRNRWFGFVRREADANDITDGAIEWLDEHRDRKGDRPFLLWVHYVDPHAPYRLHQEHKAALGLEGAGDLTKRDRYDTEIAFVDASIGRLLDGLDRLELVGETLIVFTSDHGESLGEHGYWGHGRNLHEPNLRIPLSMTWVGRLRPMTVDAPALIIDLAPTILGLLEGPSPPTFRGFDWRAVLEGGPAPTDRQTHYQTHRGAVISKHDSDLARQSGLLEVGVIHNEIKEIFRVQSNRGFVYDLRADPRELRGDALDKDRSPSEGLMTWMRSVYAGLHEFDVQPPEPLDEESIEQLRSLGYVD